MSIAKGNPCINSKDTDENNNPLLEYENGHLIGKHPKNTEIFSLKQSGHSNLPLAQIIRKKCLDCCAFQAREVRKCVCTSCPLWPYRMGKNPFQAAKHKGKPSNLNKTGG
tara:strand:+ start:312 stop:641 length:330 start_codon:yes stop_codon:yes gene_type:complete